MRRAPGKEPFGCMLHKPKHRLGVHDGVRAKGPLRPGARGRKVRQRHAELNENPLRRVQVGWTWTYKL